MSGTSAGARRGWKTRTGQLPPVSAGRHKSPIRQAAGKKANYTRKLHKENRERAAYYGNFKNSLATRAHLRGEMTGAQLDEFRKEEQREYERRLRMNPVRHRKRGR